MGFDAQPPEEFQAAAFSPWSEMLDRNNSEF